MIDFALTNVAALLVVFPVAGALLCFLLPDTKRVWAGILTAVLTTVLALLAAGGVAVSSGQRHTLGGWVAPLGIELYLDGLSAVFIAMTALVALPVSLYARTYFAKVVERPGDYTMFWPLWLTLWAGLNGIYLSADLFNLFVVIEVAGICAVALAVLSGKQAALIGGLRYLLAAVAGSMAYLMGVVLIYGSTGVLDISLAAARIEPGFTLRVAIALTTVGLLVKTAVFPLHFWLPPAHSAAEPPVSAILSALVVKGTFYIILRLWVELFDVAVTFAAAQALGVLGAAAAVWGSYQALRQERLKLIAAHSTVGQIGFMFLLFPLITLAPGGDPDAPWLAWAWSGGIYQAISHAFAKAALFLSIGIYVLAVGSDRREAMVDLVGRLPMTTFAIGLAGVSLIGLPPSGGFFAKWMLLKAAIASGQWWWVPVILWASFLTAGYVFMILRQAFAPSPKPVELRPVPRMLEVTALLLGVGAVVIGLRADEVLQLLGVDAPFEEPIIEEPNGGIG